MRIIDTPLAALRLQYRIARFPLQLIEQRVFARMEAEAPARLFYERSFGLLDAVVGNILGDRKIQRGGAALARRSDALGRAAQLDADAEGQQQRSRADLKARNEEATKDWQDALATKQQKVEDARTVAEERKRAAEDFAARRTAEAKKRADDLAAQRTRSAEATKRDEHAKIRANEQQAANAAKSKLDDAGAKRSEANAKRTQADRIEDLADEEKRKRQAARADNK